MQNSKWVIHRIGLIDFWYYDDEELFFENGRMLLRGSNGSGKSVTMQSFIPLLLDANKSPARLDPFGSRERRLENYMIDEDGERDDRTGYLYMEFKRERAEIFATVGMGLRARKNKPLDAWYFVIDHNKRVGQDIRLCRNDRQIGKVSLSKSELKTALSDNGTVFDRQSEYMDAVNRLLFGFKSNEEYGELIDLLIQLRTPKLSKDFKPTVINEILSESLPPLSDEDLRPMSEAIENMDNIKTRIDALVESQKAADRILQVYDRYNKAVLYEKASACMEYGSKLKQLDADINTSEQEHERMHDELDVMQHNYDGLNEDFLLVSEQKTELERDHADEIRTKEEIDKTAKDREDHVRSRKFKQTAIDDKERRYRIVTEDINKKESEAEDLISKARGLSHEMGELSYGIAFTEHEMAARELFSDISKPYDYSFVKNQAVAYESKILKGLEMLRERDERAKRHDEATRLYDISVREKEDAISLCEQAEELFTLAKAELVERLHIWNSSNTRMILDKKRLDDISEIIGDFNAADRQLDTGKLTSAFYFSVKSELNQRMAAEDVRKKTLEAEHAQKASEIAELEAKKAIEPERPADVVANRLRLRELGIPYTEFYKILSFDDSVDEDNRNRFEEALYRMGILDALVVPDAYSQAVLSMDRGLCDRYIFRDMPARSQTAPSEAGADDLSTVLRLDTPEGEFSIEEQEIEGVLRHALRSIGIGCGIKGNDSSDRSTVIDPAIGFQLGIVTGSLSKTYTSRFIGEAARERNRIETLARMHAELETINENLAAVSRVIEDLRLDIQTLDQEYEAIPSANGVLAAADTLRDCEARLQQIREIVDKRSEDKRSALERLDEMRQQIHELSETIELPVDLQSFQDALKDIRAYKELLHELENCHNKLLSVYDVITTMKDQAESIEEDMDALRYDLNRLDKQIETLSDRIALLTERLKLSNYEMVKEQIDLCTRRIKELPVLIQEMYSKSNLLKKDIDLKQNVIASLKRARDEQRIKYQAIKEALADEYMLDLVELKSSEDIDITEETGLRRLCVCLQKGYTDSLSLQKGVQEQYFQNTGRLAEYNVVLSEVFSDNPVIKDIKLRRIDILCKLNGKQVRFPVLIKELNKWIQENVLLFNESEKKLFEEILADNIGKKIRDRIYSSEQWVERMNELMNGMDTSGGLSLSLEWKRNKAETEDQMNTNELVELLKKDAVLMKESDIERLSTHFRSKIAAARKRMEDYADVKTFHAIMKDILDYRKWFEFKLYYQKTGEVKKELTNKAFFRFSGGEKAMAMYVPLFSAVAAKYRSARPDAPHLLSLDEAFAGVDDRNVRDMFRLMVEFDFNFIINSQVLWGDYDTVPCLSIYQLYRPNNVKYVTLIRYIWNGSVKAVVDKGVAV